MPQLFFKKVFWDAIRAGRKTTTLRRWAKCRIHPGGRVYTLGLGWLTIGNVEIIEFESLGEDDAKADGFDSLAELKKAIDKIYPDYQTDGKQWYRIYFTWDAKTVVPAKGQRVGKPRRIKVVSASENTRIARPEKSTLAGLLRIQLDKAVAASRLSPHL